MAAPPEDSAASQRPNMAIAKPPRFWPSATQSIDGALGRRRAYGWRTVPSLGAAISTLHLAARATS
jgi:hypothetical protein